MQNLMSLTNLKNHNGLVFLFLIFIILFSISQLQAAPGNTQKNFIAQLEFGPVWQGRNDVQIPNNESGTRFSLKDLTGSGPFPAIRFYLTWRINERNDLRVLLAPLSITETGILNKPVSFAGRDYQSGVATEGSYKFNSWRLTYRYKFHHGEQWHWWIGFTAKIRDAKIKLKQNDVSSEKTDLGFVPLLHIRGEYHWNPKWWILFDLDALAGGPGRAEDGTLQFGYNLSEKWSVSAGYRTVEGGADVDEVYNFAWFHYLVLSTNFTF